MTRLTFLFLFLCFVRPSVPLVVSNGNNYYSFGLTLQSRSVSPNNPFASRSDQIRKRGAQATVSHYRSSFRYSSGLIVSLPIGTPPQTQQLVLDTGSQLSWVQCQKRRSVSSAKKPPSKRTFNPRLSSSFSFLPCTHPLCRPRVPDYSVPTSCDGERRCHYSYFYADGTLAEGNLGREKIALSHTKLTPPLILGCSSGFDGDKGILGMNQGRLSFPSQTNITKFSYCVPTRGNPTGTLYLGPNPHSHAFKYVTLLTFSGTQRMPNLDPFAYTIPIQGIRIGSKRLNISASVFRPNAGGAGQTIMDSGSEFTYLVDEAYDRVREEVTRLTGSRLKESVAGTGADMCFEGKDGLEVGKQLGSIVLELEKGVEMVVEGERVLSDVGGGVQCIGIGRSSMLGAANNVIGNLHQQNHWIEYDVGNHRLGLGSAPDCSGSP